MSSDARRARLVRRLLAAPDARAARALVRAEGAGAGPALARAIAERFATLLRESPKRSAAAVRALKAVAGATKDAAARAHALSAEGALAHEQGRPTISRRAFREAAEIHRKANAPLAESDAWRALVEVERNAGRLAAAKRAFARALRAIEGRGHERVVRRGALLMNMGNLHFQADRHEDALREYASARRLLERRGDTLRVATCDYNRANILATLDRTSEARALYESARTTFAERGHAASVAACDYALAGLDVLEGRLDEGLVRLESSRERRARLGDAVGAAHAELDAADALLRLNRPVEAATHAAAARSFFRRAGQPASVAIADAVLAGAGLQQGRPRDARSRLQSAVQWHRRSGNAVAGALATIGLATAELRAGRADRALALARRAAQRLTRARLPPRAARAHVVASEAHLAKGSASRALASARLATRLATGREARVEMAAHLAEARALEALGRPADAHRRLLRAAELVEQLRLGVTAEESQLAFALDKSEVFEALVANRLAVGTNASIREALLHAERGKARALAERLASGAGVTATTPAARRTVLRLKEIDRRLAVAESRLQGEGGAKGLRSVREDEVTRLMVQRARILSELRRRAPSQALALGAADVDPWAGISTLRPGEVALEYVEAEGWLHLFTIEGGDVQVAPRIARADDVRELVDRLRFQLGKGVLGDEHAQRHSAFLEASARRRLSQLHDLVVAPAAARLDGKGVRVVPHGVLHGVPFQALEKDGVPLVERAIVSHVPSLAVLGLLARHRAAGAEPPLVLGVPDGAAPEIEAEVAAIGRRVAGARVYRGATATADALRLAERGPSLLHVACHGFFTESGTGGGALRLGDAWLSLPELQAMRGTGDLVVLSGCETGRGTVHAGDEWVGLVRAFLLAGARCVVASLWEVHDRSTADLMDDFYAHLGSGLTVGESLASAQRAARRRGAALLHWAPFVAVGDPGLRLHLRRAA